MTKTKVTQDDIFAIHSVTSPVWCPNDEKVAYIKTSIDQKKNTYYSYLYVAMAGEEGQQWTFGEERISAVKWSPSGKYISFLSTRKDKNQLFILSPKGGESKQLTRLPFGVQSYEWDPSETSVWFTAAYEEEKGWNSESSEEKEDKDKFPEPYVVEKMKYIQDGNGLVKQGRLSQIGTVSLEDSTINRWSTEMRNEQVQSVSSDGKWLVISSNPLEDDDRFESSLYLVDSESKIKQMISPEGGYYGGATFSFDGSKIGYVGYSREYENATHADLFVYSVPEQSTVNLTEMLDAPVGDYVVADIQQGASAPSLVWTEQDHIYFQVSTHGDVRVYVASLEGEIYPATPEGEHVYGYDVSKDGKQLALTVSNPTSPGELYTQVSSTGQRTKVTAFNDAYCEQTDLLTPEAIVFEGPNGFEVHGWILKPREADQGKVPMITNIHGGPHAFYANTFFHEMQLLAAQGYGVLYINPRGSHSYSQQFVDAVRGDYGGNDYLDIMAAVDYALANYDWIDQDRLGVTGGSYGGFMTNWIVGHTNRFKAAVTQRSISNWISFYGVSDIGYYFTEWQIHGDMNDIDKLWDHSPLKYAAQIETPLLILHGENDLRCPIEQAQQLYITLKRMGKETGFVRFPQADHNLSRTGLPNLRIARLEQIVGWFEKYV